MIGCGVPLDRCRQAREPHARRWDYVFVVRGSSRAIAVEVHHADVNEVDVMIAKKRWAESLLAEHCPSMLVELWVWVASPPASEVFFLPQHPYARRLADASISFPRVSCKLP